MVFCFIQSNWGRTSSSVSKSQDFSPFPEPATSLLRRQRFVFIVTKLSLRESKAGRHFVFEKRPPEAAAAPSARRSPHVLTHGHQGGKVGGEGWWWGDELRDWD